MLTPAASLEVGKCPFHPLLPALAQTHLLANVRYIARRGCEGSICRSAKRMSKTAKGEPKEAWAVRQVMQVIMHKKRVQRGAPLAFGNGNLGGRSPSVHLEDRGCACEAAVLSQSAPNALGCQLIKRSRVRFPPRSPRTSKSYCKQSFAVGSIRVTQRVTKN